MIASDRRFDFLWQVVKYFEEGGSLYVKKNHEDYVELKTVNEVLTYQHRLFIKEEK
jgi:hypothetical protein